MTAIGTRGGRHGDPAIVALGERHWLVTFRVPAPAVERGEGDAAPMHAPGLKWVALHLDAHYHGAALLDLADLAELDVIGEAGDQ